MLGLGATGGGAIGVLRGSAVVAAGAGAALAGSVAVDFAGPLAAVASTAFFFATSSISLRLLLSSTIKFAVAAS